MNKVLILTSELSPGKDANSKIAIELGGELEKRGYVCHFIGIGDKNEVKNVHLITKSFYSKYKNVITTLIRRVFQFFLFFIHPNYDWGQNRKVYKKIKTLDEIYDFDYIISINKPYSNIAASYKYKKNNPQKIVFAYCLDLLTNETNRVVSFVSSRQYVKIMNVFDHVYLPQNYEGIFNSNSRRSNKNNVTFLEIPSYIKHKELEKTIEKVDNNIRVIFAGTLNSKFRNPKSLLLFFSTYCKQYDKKIVFDIYGTIDKAGLLETGNNSGLTIRFFGKVSGEEIQRKYREYDFIVNIGNKDIYNAVPSKIFEIFSYLMPVINFSFSQDDASLIYIKRYPLAFSIIYDQFDYTSFNNFINESKGKKVSQKIADNIFSNHTIGFIADTLSTDMEVKKWR